MATVFEAFPNAIVSDDWKLGGMAPNTDIGVVWTDLGYKSVIVDEGSRGMLDMAPTAEGIESDTLIYAKPSELPGLEVAKYVSDYLWYQESADQYYRIIEVGIGKNQQSGVVEHVEFRLKPTDATEAEESDSES